MMNPPTHIICTVTNDLNQDQRMHRICNSLHNDGYIVTLTGRKKVGSERILHKVFRQKRLNCIFHRGPLFYLEFNIRLFCFLMYSKNDLIYSVDYDTLPACTLVAVIKRKKLIFDAHEYFTEVPELEDRTLIKGIWNIIAKLCIPFCNICITVNQSLADILSERFRKKFHVIYNVPDIQHTLNNTVPPEKPYVLLYQGMLNKGRGLEVMIEAMCWLPDCTLMLAGEGDLSKQLRDLAEKSPSKNRIRFVGWQNPDSLTALTLKATLGLNLLESNSLNYYYSLANKFFDYMHAGVPSVNMDYPEYRRIIDDYKAGILIPDLSVNTVVNSIRRIIEDTDSYMQMKKECVKAAKEYNWEKECKKLSDIFNKEQYGTR